MKHSLFAGALLACLASGAHAQVTFYGRVDVSVAQQADAVDNKELRNGSGSRFGVRGVEDLGDGFKAVFHLEHRFDADTGVVSNATRFWEGKSIVGLEGGYGRLTLGREENPAYTYSQNPADPWGSDTVASNGNIVNGRIGSTRYSGTINYRYGMAGFTFGAQYGEAEKNVPAGGIASDQPYSLGLAYAAGPLSLGLGYENPADADDDWLTVSGAYNLGVVKLGGLLGSGKNVSGQKHQSWLLSAVMPVSALGQLRLSYGQLKNQDTGVLRDKQLGLGYHYSMSTRTTVYADLVNKSRDNMAANLNRTGYDFGIKHNF
jgi:predicted porin